MQNNDIKINFNKPKDSLLNKIGKFCRRNLFRVAQKAKDTLVVVTALTLPAYFEQKAFNSIITYGANNDKRPDKCDSDYQMSGMDVAIRGMGSSFFSVLAAPIVLVSDKLLCKATGLLPYNAKLPDNRNNNDPIPQDLLTEGEKFKECFTAGAAAPIIRSQLIRPIFETNYTNANCYNSGR